MKKSNVIIIAFAVFILGSILILFIDAKRHENDAVINEGRIENKEFLVSDFSVVVAEKDADVHIHQSDTNKILVEYKDSLSDEDKLYNISNDTLYVYSGHRTFVKGKNVKSMIGREAFWIGVHKFSGDSLNVDLSGSKMYFNYDKENSKIGFMNLSVRDTAYFEMYNGIEIKELKINSQDNSKIELYGSYESIYAELHDNSLLILQKNPEDMQLNKDKTSKLVIYNQ